MRAFAVVVGYELTKDALVSNEQPIKALSSCCAHKSFRDRVRLRGSNGCLDNSGARRTKYLVEGRDELGVPVTDKETHGAALVLEGCHQVAGLLGDPWADRVGRDTGQEDLAPLQRDEEQDIDASQHHRVDVEKVARQSAGGLGAQELRPGWS